MIHFIQTDPLAAMFVVALLANSLVAGVAYGLSGAADQHARQVWGWARRTFTRAGDDYPQTPETIARAQAVQRLERQRAGIDDDGHPRRLRGLVEIHRASLESVAHVDEAARRRHLLALVESSPRRKTVH
jgi:hypothetical protein